MNDVSFLGIYMINNVYTNMDIYCNSSFNNYIYYSNANLAINFNNTICSSTLFLFFLLLVLPFLTLHFGNWEFSKLFFKREHTNCHVSLSHTLSVSSSSSSSSKPCPNYVGKYCLIPSFWWRKRSLAKSACYLSWTKL